MERLTIKELAPYLPYGLKVAFIVRYEIRRIATLSSLYDIENYYDIKLSIGHSDSEHIWMFKPLLRPLSQLTEEIEHNGEKFVPKDKIPNYTKVDENGTLYILVDGTQWQSNPLRWDYETVNWLISLHFDVFGLIDRGLALPIDGKEVKP